MSARSVVMTQQYKLAECNIQTDPTYFRCDRLHARIPKETCIYYRKLARIASKPGYAPPIAYEREVTCRQCEQGKGIEQEWRQGKIKIVPRPRPRYREKIIKPKESHKKKIYNKKPITDEDVNSKPLCSKCGRWNVYSRGLCQSCYQAQYRARKKM